MKITQRFIISLLLFSIIPIILLGILSIKFSKDLNLQEFENNSGLILTELSKEVLESIKTNKNILTSITISMLEFGKLKGNEHRIQSLLCRYIFDYDTIMELYIFDENSRLIICTDAREDVNESLVNEMNRFLNTESFTPKIMYTEDQIPYYYDFELGFLADGTQYIIVSKTSLISIWVYLHLKKIGEEGIIFLVDSNDQIIAHPDIQLVFREEKFKIPDQHGENFFYLNFRGIKCIGIAQDLLGGQITIILERPIREVFITSRRISMLTVLIVLVILIMIIISSTRFGGRIVRNINNLKTGMQTIALGELTHRIEPKGEVEFQEIAEGINIMTDKVIEMQNELAEKKQLAEIGTLTSKIAHDLRNPLTPIKTFSELLPEKFDDPEFRKKFITIVLPRIEYIDEFISEMLTYGRPYQPEVTTFDLVELIEELIVLWQEEVKKQEITISFINDFEKLEVSADKEKIFEAMMNLIKNSIEAISELEQKTDSEIIEIKLEKNQDDNKFRLTIHDTGKPIPESERYNLFKPFYSTKKTGTGLGLPIVKKILQTNNWTITPGNKEKFVITN